jgi:hypothetical protein
MPKLIGIPFEPALIFNEPFLCAAIHLCASSAQLRLASISSASFTPAQR